MAGNRYSLTDYTVTVIVPNNLSKKLFLGSKLNTITIGGKNSYTDSITIETSQDLWTTKGDYTGSWVHEKNLDLTGTCTIKINQLSEVAYRLKTLCNIYRKSDTNCEGLTMELHDARNGKTIVKMSDCLIKKIPSLSFETSSSSQSWEFTCGKIDYQD